MWQRRRSNPHAKWSVTSPERKRPMEERVICAYSYCGRIFALPARDSECVRCVRCGAICCSQRCVDSHVTKDPARCRRLQSSGVQPGIDDPAPVRNTAQNVGHGQGRVVVAGSHTRSPPHQQSVLWRPAAPSVPVTSPERHQRTITLALDSPGHSPGRERAPIDHQALVRTAALQLGLGRGMADCACSLLEFVAALPISSRREAEVSPHLAVKAWMAARYRAPAPRAWDERRDPEILSVDGSGDVHAQVPDVDAQMPDVEAAHSAEEASLAPQPPSTGKEVQQVSATNTANAEAKPDSTRDIESQPPAEETEEVEATDRADAAGEGGAQEGKKKKKKKRGDSEEGRRGEDEEEKAEKKKAKKKKSVDDGDHAAEEALPPVPKPPDQEPTRTASPPAPAPAPVEEAHPPQPEPLPKPPVKEPPRTASPAPAVPESPQEDSYSDVESEHQPQESPRPYRLIVDVLDAQGLTAEESLVTQVVVTVNGSGTLTGRRRCGGSTSPTVWREQVQLRMEATGTRATMEVSVETKDKVEVGRGAIELEGLPIVVAKEHTISLHPSGTLRLRCKAVDEGTHSALERTETEPVQGLWADVRLVGWEGIPGKQITLELLSPGAHRQRELIEAGAVVSIPLGYRRQRVGVKVKDASGNFRGWSWMFITALDGRRKEQKELELGPRPWQGQEDASILPSPGIPGLLRLEVSTRTGGPDDESPTAAAEAELDWEDRWGCFELGSVMSGEGGRFVGGDADTTITDQRPDISTLKEARAFVHAENMRTADNPIVLWQIGSFTGERHFLMFHRKRFLSHVQEGQAAIFARNASELGTRNLSGIYFDIHDGVYPLWPAPEPKDSSVPSYTEREEELDEAPDVEYPPPPAPAEDTHRTARHLEDIDGPSPRTGEPEPVSVEHTEEIEAPQEGKKRKKKRRAAEEGDDEKGGKKKGKARKKKAGEDGAEEGEKKKKKKKKKDGKEPDHAEDEEEGHEAVVAGGDDEEEEAEVPMISMQNRQGVVVATYQSAVEAVLGGQMKIMGGTILLPAGEHQWPSGTPLMCSIRGKGKGTTIVKGAPGGASDPFLLMHGDNLEISNVTIVVDRPCSCLVQLGGRDCSLTDCELDGAGVASNLVQISGGSSLVMFCTLEGWLERAIAVEKRAEANIQKNHFRGGGSLEPVLFRDSGGGVEANTRQHERPGVELVKLDNS
eukprot:Hpha_TRINITY_DN16373_c1_g2::TRINITY_DN16373_c1_g2_i1::g.62392::m.62392